MGSDQLCPACVSDRIQVQAVLQKQLCQRFTIVAQHDFADIDKLGTVLDPEKSITIQDESGTVTVEYVAPTRRRIILNGETREFDVRKSWRINGVFAGEPLVKFREGPIGDIYFQLYHRLAIPLCII